MRRTKAPPYTIAAADKVAGTDQYAFEHHNGLWVVGIARNHTALRPASPNQSGLSTYPAAHSFVACRPLALCCVNLELDHRWLCPGLSAVSFQFRNKNLLDWIRHVGKHKKKGMKSQTFLVAPLLIYVSSAALW